jgi:hypothetical protein
LEKKKLKETDETIGSSEQIKDFVKSALIPVVQKKIAAGKTPLEMEKLLLALKICDLSCGNAAFLIVREKTPWLIEGTVREFEKMKEFVKK